MIVIIVLLALFALAALAPRFGFDSRESAPSREEELAALGMTWVTKP
jgi:hypothetical protein